MIELPVVSAIRERAGARPGQKVACLDCGMCCTYCAIEINPPTSPSRVSMILWYLYHPPLAIYRDPTNEWLVMVAGRCKHLNTDLSCAVYERRPSLCREFSSNTCEVNGNYIQGSLEFRTPEEFAEWMRKQKPKTWARAVRAKVTGQLE